MSDELEARLRQLSQEIADAAPTAHGWSTVEQRAENDVVETQRSRWPVAGAAVAIVVLGVGTLIAINSLDDEPVADVPPASTPTAGAGSTRPTGSSLPPPTSTIDRAFAQEAIEAAQSAPPIVIASDDSVLASGEVWEFRVRIARTAEVTAVCTENVGTSVACHVLPVQSDGPMILGYGGAPTPVVDVWSATDFTDIVAVLSDGQSLTAAGINTDAGTFAALPFSADNPPVSLIARTAQGDIDLHLADFVSADADLAGNWGN